MNCFRIFIARHGQIASGEFLNNDPDLPKEDPILYPSVTNRQTCLQKNLNGSNSKAR